jgi:tetratricopeptide (TPR) repeat protein
VALAHDNLGTALAAQGKVDEAEREHRRAIELAPDFPPPHHNLALALDTQGRLDEALVEFRRAISLNPNEVRSHNNLGMLLLRKQQWDEAIAEFRKALALAPQLGTVNANLGLALMDGGRLPEAVAAFRKAIQLDARDPRAYCGLGEALFRQGKFVEGAAALRHCRDLRPQGSYYNKTAVEELRSHERQIALDEELTAILKGGDRPAGARCLELAEFCSRDKRLHWTAVQFYAEGLSTEPRTLTEPGTVWYRAARSAVLAADGDADDGRVLPDKVTVGLRQQALAWLRADLVQSVHLAGGPPAVSRIVRERLARWRTDTALASVRDTSALARLPEDERGPWRRFWDDVAALQHSLDAPGGTTPSPRPH